jgi:hypothetical protein
MEIIGLSLMRIVNVGRTDLYGRTIEEGHGYNLVQNSEIIKKRQRQ